MTAKSEARGKSAITKRRQGSRPRYLIDIANNEHITLIRSLIAGQRSESLVQKCIAREMLARPSIALLEIRAGEVHNAMNDLRCEFLENGILQLVEEIEWLGRFLECLRGLHDDEIINDIAQFVQADFGPVEFGVDEEEVVDFARPVTCRVG